jgi:hypothetical protein
MLNPKVAVQGSGIHRQLWRNGILDKDIICIRAAGGRVIDCDGKRNYIANPHDTHI